MNDSHSEALAVREHVAAEIRAELARRRMSVRQAARQLGWGSTATHRRLTGESPLDAGHLHEIARMLGVPVQQFFPDDLALRRGQMSDHTSGFLAMAC
jgi:transcriptional regulator with XRE-family HTH domain